MDRYLRFVTLSVCALVVVCLTSLVAPAAQATLAGPTGGGTTATLCTGYSGCSRAGMGNAGYAGANDRMYWRMYSGHNCTNYVAYRMVHGGMPNTRPWTGSGNATNWGPANPSITDQTPTVGAVAWWRAYHRPAGSAGHVAYVEQVVSQNEIIVSQDSWGGDFSWARLTRTGGKWPSGFVHFNDLSLSNTRKPVVSGTAKVGSTLSTTAGAWSPTDATVSYRWRADGVRIGGAAGSTFKLTNAQQGKRISVKAIAKKAGYPTAAAISAPTAAVQPGAITNPVRPTVSGDPQVGEPLRVSTGTWTPSSTRLSYQWRVASDRIPGATSATFTPDATQVGKKVSVLVTGALRGYAPVTTRSAKSTRIVPGTLEMSRAPALDGTLRPGRTLTVDRGAVTPGDATVAVQWLRSGVPVAGATGSSYALGAADLGSVVTARLTARRAGYEPLVTTTPATTRVRTASRLTVRTVPKHGRLRITTTVTATGVRPVTGFVGIRMHGRLVRLVPLSHGRAVTTLKGLSAGEHGFRVRYRGSRTVETVSVWKRARVR